jgi:hypothetical protein
MDGSQGLSEAKRAIPLVAVIKISAPQRAAGYLLKLFPAALQDADANII